MVQNIKKEKKNFELEKENIWNHKYHFGEEKLPQYKIDLNPTHLRQQITNKKININKSKIRPKSANKISLIVSNKKNTSNNTNSTNSKLTSQQITRHNSLLLNNELFSQILKLWEKLGVTQHYQNIFENVSSQLSSSNYLEGYLKKELSHLNNINNLVLKIIENVTSREKHIQLLQNYDIKVREENIQKKSNIDENLINDIHFSLNELRMNSISIVKNYIELRKICGYESLMSKLEIDKIPGLKKNYLIIMKNDTDFLSNSSLIKYFSFAPNDPFLTSIGNEKDNSKQKIPISEEIKEEIKEYQYFFIDEIIFNEINKFNIYNNLNKNDYTLSSSYSLVSITSSKRKQNTEIISKIKDYDTLNHVTKSNKKELKPIRPNTGFQKKKKGAGFNKKVNPINLLTSQSSFTDEFKRDKSPLIKKKVNKNDRSREKKKDKFENNFDDLKNDLKKDKGLGKKELEQIDQILNRGINDNNLNKINKKNYHTLSYSNNHNNDISSEYVTINDVTDNTSEILSFQEKKNDNNRKNNSDLINFENQNKNNKDDESVNIKYNNEIIKNKEIKKAISKGLKNEMKEKTEINKNNENEIKNIKEEYNNIKENNDLNEEKKEKIEKKNELNEINESIEDEIIKEEIKENIEKENKEEKKENNIKDLLNKMDLILNESQTSKDNIKKNEIIEDKDEQNEENNIVIDNQITGHIEKENEINNTIIPRENKEENDDSEFDRSDEKNSIEKNENKEIKEEKEINNISEIIESMNIDNLEIKEGYNFYIQPYSGNIVELNKIFTNFLLKIPQDQKIAFNIDDDISKYISGIYPKLILLKNKDGIIQGLSIISFDPLAQISKSINLLLICCLSNDILSNILKDILKYLTENLDYDEIRIELYYGIKNDQFYLIKDIEKSLKEDAKFKWVNMENDGIHRKIKYKYQNPNKKIDFSIIPSAKNILELKTASLISLNSDKNNINDNKIINKNNELNDFGIISIISEMVSMEDYEINYEKDNSFSDLLQKIQFNKLIKITNEFIQNQLGTFEEAKQFINENLSNLTPLINDNFIKSSLIGTSLMKVEVTFETVIRTSIKGFVYNIISNNDIEVFTYQNGENNYTDNYFYLLHSSNENLSFIIYEFKNNMKFEDLIDSEENNICEIFQNIYTKLNQQPKKIMKRIYLPTFKICKSKVYDNLLFLNGIQLTNDKGNYYIQNLNQIEDFVFGVENNKNNLINANLSLQSIDKNKDIVIKDEFLIALINADLLCDMHIPTISAFIVKKKFWEKE